MQNSKKSLRLLIVDDSPEDRAKIRRLLLTGSEQRYQFTEAEMGEECLAACTQDNAHAFDCILLNYHLPDYDAPDLLLAMGKQKATFCPIVVLTNSSQHPERTDLIRLGAQDFISKNLLNPESLKRSVENAIERYKLGQEINYSHKRFEAFLENSALIAWMKDAECRYIYLSHNFEKRFNVRLEDWRGKTDFELWPRPYAEQYYGDDQQVLLSNRNQELIETVEDGDGNVSWWLTSKFPFVDQNGQKFVGGMAVDITERKLAEQALEKSEALSSSIIANSADCIKVIDLNGNIKLVNDVGICLLELDNPNDILNRNWVSTWPGAKDDIERALDAASKGDVGQFRGLRKTPKGNQKWWDVRVTAIMGSTVKPSYFIAISRDITEQQRKEEQLKDNALLHAYTIELTDTLIALSDPFLIKKTASTLLGKRLQASRVHYGRVIENGQIGVVRADYCDNVPSLVGQYKLDEYGALTMSEIRAGHTLIINNVADDERLEPEEKRRTLDLGVEAYVIVPLVKQDKLVAFLVAHQITPRNWSALEVTLIEETARRTWEAVQRGLIENKLRASETKLATIINQATAGLAELDLTGRFIFVNDRYCALVGRSRKELLQLHRQDIIFPKDLEGNELKYQRCLNQGQEFTNEQRYLRPDQTTIWVRNHVALLRDNDNKPTSILKISFDITDHKQTEATLAANEERLRLAQDAAKAGTWEWDLATNQTIWSNNSWRLFGLEPNSLPSNFDTWTNTIHPEDRESLVNAVMASASKGDLIEIEWRTIHKDGEIKWILSRGQPLFDDDGKTRRYIGINMDINERKQIEASQRRLEQRLLDQQLTTRSLIESNVDALATIDPTGIISDVNGPMETLTGYNREELIGTAFKDYFTRPKLAETIIKRVLRKQKLYDYELTVQNKNGKQTVVSYNAATFFDTQGELLGVFASGRDITERKRFEQQLNERNVELTAAKIAAEKANLAKSEFLSRMSHELRSPLNSILGFAQLLETGNPPLEEKQSLRIHQIIKAGWYLLELINEVLDLAVIEAGKVSLSLECVALGELLDECETMILPDAESRDIKADFDKPQCPVHVFADRTRLKQVLLNLLSNAVKYNRPGGGITVICDGDDPAQVCLKVKDTGEGIAPEKLEQLFQPFNRLGKENTATEGTGIGLVVTKELVEMMGGTIGVDTELGVGSTFWVKLPRSPQHPS